MLRSVLIDQQRSRAVDGVTLGGVHGAAVIHGITRDVEHPAQHRFADRYGDRSASVQHVHAALESFGAAHCDGADQSFAKVLLRFQLKVHALAGYLEVDLQRVVDFRQYSAGGKVHVEHGTDDLDDFAGGGGVRGFHKRGLKS